MLMRKILVNTGPISVPPLGTFCNNHSQGALVNPLSHRQVVAPCRLALAHRPRYLPTTGHCSLTRASIAFHANTSFGYPEAVIGSRRT
jgi:hypothetical protein